MPSMSSIYKGSCFALTFLFCTLSINAQVKKTNNIYVTTGVYSEFDYASSYLSVIEGGIILKKNRWVMFAPEVIVYKFWNEDYSSLGIGLRPAFRFYPLQKRAFALFTEIKGGIIYMWPEYRYASFNYAFACGGGTEIKLPERKILNIGLGYNHFSNGLKYGYTKNPTWDGLGGYIGLISFL